MPPEEGEGEQIKITDPPNIKFRGEGQREKTRVRIASCLTALIIVLFLAFGYRLLFDSTALPAEHLDTYKTTIALLMGVYGTVVGFYFGSASQ